MKNIALTIILALITTTSILAKNKNIQKETLTGKVFEMEQGKTKPLALAYIYIENSVYCTYTDTDGNFELTLPKGTKAFYISFMGMATQKVTIGNSNEIECILKPTPSTVCDL